MQVITTAEEMHHVAVGSHKRGLSIGLVPTMGALHEGHLSLVRASRKENRVTVASVFVNPTQFGPNEDFDRYPRTFDADKALLEKEKCDYLFHPPVEEMYDPDDATRVTVEGLDKHLCGLRRPGHFQGVTTVVSKLFNIVQPDRAYFGQKDYQQSVIIRKMTRDMRMGVEIRVMPIVREDDGLALSSRNRYLLPEEREQAVALCRALQEAERIIKTGERQSFKVVYELEQYLKREAPLGKIDYISVVHPDTLEDLKTVAKPVVVALAVWFGKTRLIDNAIIRG